MTEAEKTDYWVLRLWRQGMRSVARLAVNTGETNKATLESIQRLHRNGDIPADELGTIAYATRKLHRNPEEVAAERLERERERCRRNYANMDAAGREERNARRRERRRLGAQGADARGPAGVSARPADANDRPDP